MELENLYGVVMSGLSGGLTLKLRPDGKKEPAMLGMMMQVCRPYQAGRIACSIGALVSLSFPGL